MPRAHRAPLATWPLLALAACGDGDPVAPPDPVVEVTGLEYGGGTFDQVIAWGGIARSYTVVVPPSAAPDRPAPLVLVYHAAEGVPADVRDLSGFDHDAAERGWVVAYLASAGDNWALSPLVPPGLDGLDDTGFTREVVRRIEEDLAVDRTRVHAVGFGEGGVMAHRIGCSASDLVGSVASVGSGISFEVVDTCPMDRPVSVIHVAGTLDPVFPWTGGRIDENYGILTQLGGMRWWADQLRCAPALEITGLPDTSDDGTRVERTRFNACPADAEVALYTVLDGGHTWPGSAADLPPANGLKSLDIDATALIAIFFQEHPR